MNWQLAAAVHAIFWITLHAPLLRQQKFQCHSCRSLLKEPQQQIMVRRENRFSFPSAEG